MGDTSDSVLPQEIEGILNNVSHLNESNNSLNNSNNQAKILDYYKPKHSGKDSIVTKVEKYSLTQHKAKNETQSILEDVCNDFESIDVTPLKNGCTTKIIHHSTPINVTESFRKQESCYGTSSEELLVKGNDSLVSFECKEIKPCEYQDNCVIKIVTPPDLQKICILPFEKSSEQAQSTSVNPSLKPVDCAISTSVNHSISLGSDDHIVSKRLCNNIIPHISNLNTERDTESAVSSFTVSDNVEVLKDSDGNDIEFGEYYIQEDSEYLENQTTIDGDNTNASSPNEDQSTFEHSHDGSESTSISSKSALTEIIHDSEGNVHVSPSVKNARARRISAKMKKQWAKEISASGHLVCPMLGCHQKYITVANFQTHYKWCTGKKTLQHCPYCDSLIFSGVEAVLHHMLVEHPEKADEYKEKCANEVASLPDETENIAITKRRYKLKTMKKRGFTLKENNLTQKKNFKRDLKSVEETMDRNFIQFKKCVRFNDIVEKINSVNDEGVNKVELKNSKKFPRFSKHIKKQRCYENEVINQIDSLSGSDEEMVDCPTHAEKDEKPPRRITTKSRIVLNTQGYKRFNEHLKVTRDWASERKTYSRSRSSDLSYLSSSNDTSFSLYNVQDTYQLNESSESTGISLSIHDDEYPKEDMIALESSLMGSSIKNVSDKVMEIPHKTTLESKSLTEVQIASSIRICREREKPALAPEPAAEVNYGHLIFAQPSKISRKERATCYDNVINKSFDVSKINQRFDPVALKKSIKVEKGQEINAVSDVNKDFDNLIKTFTAQPKRKRGRPPKNAQLLKSQMVSSLNEVKHCKEDGVKLPMDLKVNSVKKRRGRPPKYLNSGKIINHVGSASEIKDQLKNKIIQSPPIVYNEIVKVACDENNKVSPECSSHKISPQICSDVASNALGEVNEIQTLNKEDMTDSSSTMQNLVSNYHTIAEINYTKEDVHLKELCVQNSSMKTYTVPKLRILAAAVLKNTVCAPQSISSLAVNKMLINENLLNKPVKNKHIEACQALETLPEIPGHKSSFNTYINGSSNEIQEIISNIIEEIDAPLKYITAVQNFDSIKNTDDDKADQLSNTHNCLTSKQMLVKDAHICNGLDDSAAASRLELISVPINEPLSTNISEQHSLALLESSILVNNNNNIIPVADTKRKRGRPLGACKTSPKKSPKSSIEEFTVKRKRGRPRKNPCPSELFQNQANVQNSSISDEYQTSFDLACKTQCTEINATKNEINDTGQNEIKNVPNNIDFNLVNNISSHDSHNDSNAINMEMNGEKMLSPFATQILNSNETAINIRKSSRVRKLKLDPDTVFLQPKKISRGNGPQTTDQIIRKTGKRGRPRKIVVDILEPVSSPNTDLEACTSSTSPEGNEDLTLNHSRKGSRKGRPRKCVRYVDLNSGIDSRESFDYSVAQNIQSIPDAEFVESERKVIEAGKCVANCISNECEEDLVKSKDASDSTSEGNTILNSACNDDLAAKPINLQLKIKENVSKLLMDKSGRLHKNKFKHDLFHKYKSKDISHRNKIKLHKMNRSSIQSSRKNSENIDSSECRSVADTTETTNEVVLNCKSDTDSHLQESASLTPTSALRKTRLAAIKAQKLLGDILHAERDDISAGNVNDKGGKKDSNFVPEASDECQSDISEDEMNHFDEEFFKYKDHIDCPEITKRVASKNMINSWFMELEREGRVVCKSQGCDKSLGTVPGMIYHYEVACQKKLLLWRCLFCEKKFKPHSLLLLRHMEKLHFPSDKSQPCQNKARKEKSFRNCADSLPHVKKFFEQNQNVELMKTLKSRISHWKFLDCCEEFLSHFFKTSLMVKIQSDSGKQTSSNWFNLPYFKSSFGKTGDNHVSFYAGGCITCSAWCPTPYANEVSQYVCLATSEKFVNCRDNIPIDIITQNEADKGLLQLWNVGSLNSSELTGPPVLDLAIAHKHGRIRSMAWCPQGCYDHPSNFVDTSGDFFPRLGLLAAACSDAFIRVYSIPHPQYLKCASENLPFYAVEPAILLKPGYTGLWGVSDGAAVCTSVCWQRTGQSDIIMGGYDNGLVSLWDISSCNGNQNCVNPYLTFKAHSSPVTSVAFAPFSSTQWVATGGFNRLLRIWDLTDTRVPIQEHKKGSVKSIQWPLLWSGVFLSFDEGLNTKGSAYKDLASMKFLRSMSDSNHNTCEWASDFSEWLNTTVVGDAFGSVTVSTLQRLNSSNTSHTKFLTSYPIIRTEVVTLEEDDELHSAVKKCDVAAVSPFSMHPSSICTEKNIQTKLCDENKISVNDSKNMNLEDFQALSAESCNSTCRVCSKCSKCSKTSGYNATEDNVLNYASKSILNCHANKSCQCECIHADHNSEVSEVLDSIIFRIEQTTLPSTSETVSTDGMNVRNIVSLDKKLCALSKRLGLKFIISDLTNIQNEQPNVRKSENRCSVSSCFDGFHLTSVDYVQFNPNFGSHSWIFVVGQSGIVQILNVAGLQQKAKNNRR